MAKIYESALKSMREAQELLNETRKNIDDISNFVSNEMVYEPEIAARRLCAGLRKKAEIYLRNL